MANGYFTNQAVGQISMRVEELKARGETVPDDSNTIEYSINLATA